MDENTDKTTEKKNVKEEKITRDAERKIREETEKRVRGEEAKKAAEAEAAHKKESDELNADIADCKDRNLRLQAEFDNYRKRTAKERLDLISTAGEDVIKGILPVVDDFEHAIALLEKTGGSPECVEGTRLIYKKLTDYLKSRGLKEIEALGKELDTDFHDAVAQTAAPSPEQKNKIIEVIQKGYTLNGKIIRYAKVVIGI